MKIYTGFGDQGKTRLYGGQIVDKDHLRVEAYGTVDELNSILGMVITYVDDSNLVNKLHKLQNDLFRLSADLATPAVKDSKKKHTLITSGDIISIEKFIDDLDKDLDSLKNFILPGGSRAAAMIHLARTVCRRAERRIISLKHRESIDAGIIVYFNRLSDLLFVLARYVNKTEGISDIPWIQKTEQKSTE